AALAVGSSTVLVRVGEDTFGFIHQSVLEWLIARWIAQACDRSDEDEADARLASGTLSALTVDFLCDLPGRDRMGGWARQAASGGRSVESVARTNAALILQRRGVAPSAVNYAGTDLRGRDLSNQDLTGADLREADLSGAVLPRALRGADLRGASLVAA